MLEAERGQFSEPRHRPLRSRRPLIALAYWELTSPYRRDRTGPIPDVVPPNAHVSATHARHSRLAYETRQGLRWRSGAPARYAAMSSTTAAYQAEYTSRVTYPMCGVSIVCGAFSKGCVAS